MDRENKHEGKWYANEIQLQAAADSIQVLAQHSLESVV